MWWTVQPIPNTYCIQADCHFCSIKKIYLICLYFVYFQTNQNMYSLEENELWNGQTPDLNYICGVDLKSSLSQKQVLNKWALNIWLRTISCRQMWYVLVNISLIFKQSLFPKYLRGKNKTFSVLKRSHLTIIKSRNFCRNCRRRARMRDRDVI